MKKIRGFEIAKGFEKEGINLPERKTKPNIMTGIPCKEHFDLFSFG